MSGTGDNDGGREQAPLPEEPAAATAAGGSRRRGRAVLVASVLAAVCVALGTASAYFALGARGEDSRDADRASVLTAAKQEAVNLTSQNHGTIDSDLDRMIGGTTGNLRTDLDKQRTRYRGIFAKTALRAVGNATEAGIVAMHGDSATVLVVVDQVVRSDAKGQQQLAQNPHYRLQLDMSRVDGKWLASGLKAVGLAS